MSENKRLEEMVQADIQIEADRKADKRAKYRLIGSQLRRMFDDVLTEPVPDELTDFLQKIDESGGGRSDEKKAGEERE